jgi:hypothetical protein
MIILREKIHQYIILLDLNELYAGKDSSHDQIITDISWWHFYHSFGDFSQIKSRKKKILFYQFLLW